MRTIHYYPKGVCSREFTIDLDDNNVITNIIITGGCPGNLLGIRSLVIGQKAEDVISKLEGIKCGFKPTSCPDQISKALKEAISSK